MSKSINLILPTKITLEIIKDWVSIKWEVKEILRANGRTDIQISESGNSHYGISYVSFGKLMPTDEIIEDYKDCDFLDAEFRLSLKDHVIYIVYFNDHLLCCRAIKEILSNLSLEIGSCWVDNDYGKVIPAGKVLANLNADPNYAWADH
jgi:hypothetical protein